MHPQYITIPSTTHQLSGPVHMTTSNAETPHTPVQLDPHAVTIDPTTGDITIELTDSTVQTLAHAAIHTKDAAVVVWLPVQQPDPS